MAQKQKKHTKYVAETKKQTYIKEQETADTGSQQNTLKHKAQDTCRSDSQGRQRSSSLLSASSVGRQAGALPRNTRSPG